MPMTEAQLRWVRQHIGGAPPSDDDLNIIFDVYGNVEQSVEDVLATRLANFIKNPASFSVGSGKYSQNTAANIRALQDQLDKFREEHGLTANANSVRVLPQALKRDSKDCKINYGYPSILR